MKTLIKLGKDQIQEMKRNEWKVRYARIATSNCRKFCTKVF